MKFRPLPRGGLRLLSAAVFLLPLFLGGCFQSFNRDSPSDVHWYLDADGVEILRDYLGPEAERLVIPLPEKPAPASNALLDAG